MEKNKADVTTEGENVILDQQFKEGFNKSVTSEQKSKGNEGANHVDG